MKKKEKIKKKLKRKKEKRKIRVCKKIVNEFETKGKTGLFVRNVKEFYVLHIVNGFFNIL
jgi:DNA primase catalytic subunit